MSENREVKSDVFSMLMENKKYALEVYNALNGSDYTDAELIEIRTLEKGISLTIRNDAAFIVDMNLNIYEHQSTFSPNIPLRILLYLSEILKPIVRNMSIYDRKAVKIPTPRFAVFYNGSEERPEREIIKLSDLFEKPCEKPEIEITVEVYNINAGKNPDLLSDCLVLNDYSIFIDKIRHYESTGIENPIEAAIDWCIANNVLKEFLEDRKPEVLKAMTIDMTHERQIELAVRDAREEGREDGIKEGREEGIKEGIKLIALVNDGVITIADAAARAGITEEEFLEYLK